MVKETRLEERLYDSRPRMKVLFPDGNEFRLTLAFMEYPRLEVLDATSRPPSQYVITLRFPDRTLHEFETRYKNESDAREAFKEADLRFRQGYVPVLNPLGNITELITPEEFFRRTRNL